MSAETRQLRTEQLVRATGRLREALAELEKNSLALDAAIQRFEFSYELAWKALRAHLLLEGLEVSSPREAFSQAFVQGWIDDEAAWLATLADHNRTSHTYEEALARQIGERLPGYLVRLVELAGLLTARLVSTR